MPAHITPEIQGNVTQKLLYHLKRKVNKSELKISVFSDNEPTSFKLWKDMFNAEIHYVTEFPLIPVPSGYLPEEHDQYVYRLFDFIEDFFHKRRVLDSNYWGIPDFGEREDPKFHLVITNRCLRLEEFGKWLKIDEVGSEIVLNKMNTIRRQRHKFRYRDESRTTVKTLAGAAAEDPHPSSSGSGEQVPRGPTEQKTVLSVEASRSDLESVSAICSSGVERHGSSMTGCMADSSEECTAGATLSAPLPEQYPIMLALTIGCHIYHALWVGERR